MSISFQSSDSIVISLLSFSEDSRLKLLARLREKAVEIGEKGIRFLGMDSHQISQVMEFASNLRQVVL